MAHRPIYLKHTHNLCQFMHRQKDSATVIREGVCTEAVYEKNLTEETIIFCFVDLLRHFCRQNHKKGKTFT